MTLYTALWVAGIIVVAAGGAWIYVRLAAKSAESRWLPAELQHADLEFAEKTFRIWRPVPIVARIDRGYRIGNEIHLAEFKTRAILRPYRSDIIELSAQKLAVEESTGATVSDVGYVLLQDVTERKRVVKRVRLLERSEVQALVARREGILNGSVPPESAENTGLCRQCAYRRECKPSI